MTNATRDIESNGVTKGFTSWFKTKGCLGFVWKQVGKRCNKSNDKTQCFTRGVSIPELQNFVAFFGFKFCHVFSKIVLSLRDSTLHYITLHYITLHLHYVTLHYITLHYITLHTYTYTYINNTSIDPNRKNPCFQVTVGIGIIVNSVASAAYITLHYITLHYITLHTYTYTYINNTSIDPNRKNPCFQVTVGIGIIVNSVASAAFALRMSAGLAEQRQNHLSIEKNKTRDKRGDKRRNQKKPGNHDGTDFLFYAKRRKKEARQEGRQGPEPEPEPGGARKS